MSAATNPSAGAQVSESFDTVQRILRGLHAVGTSVRSGPHRRLLDVVATRRADPRSPRVGDADVAALLRHVLRQQQVSGHPTAMLEVPEELASAEALRAAELDVGPTINGFRRVTARSQWQPTWLVGPLEAIDLAMSAPRPLLRDDGSSVRTESRPHDEVPADPAVRAVAGLATYRSRAQRDAMRTVALAERPSTIHVVLPTGAGKSLVEIVPGLVSGGTTVVVVPTVALALDQERQARERFPDQRLPARLALHGSLPEEERRGLWRRLRTGEQRLLFTSPESMVGLSDVLRDLAAEGRLDFIVVDEAHLVRTWGLDFRPEFQLLGSMIADLQSAAESTGHSGPSVVLATATLSEASLVLNDELLGHGPRHWVASTYLRPELRFLLGACDDEAVRDARLLETLRRAPRPAVVYVAVPAEAERLVGLLHDNGVRRSVAFTGRSDDRERIEILEGWSGSNGSTTYDIVVGTSAFGLGVDQADVRTVVLAYTPGGVDRLYQEVGRAGRDGHAAVAVWLPVPSVDEKMGAVQDVGLLIGDERAWNRWTAMRDTARRDGEDLVVDTNVLPKHLAGAAPSEKNRLWNRNTLTLMERARLIRIVPSPAVEPGTSPSPTVATDRSQAVVRRLAGNLDEATFTSHLGSLREFIRAREAESRRRIDDLLDAERCWGRILAEEYRFQTKLSSGLVVGQAPSPSCSGCPAADHPSADIGPAPLPVLPATRIPPLQRRISADLERRFHGKDRLVVLHPGWRELMRTLPILLDKLVAHGFVRFLVPEILADHRAVTSIHQRAPGGFVAVDVLRRDAEPILDASAVPSVLVVGPGAKVPGSWLPADHPAPVPSSPRIVVCDIQAGSPHHPSASISEYHHPNIPLDHLLEAL